MTDADIFKLAEVGMFFAAIIGFCVWQWYSVVRLQRNRPRAKVEQDGSRNQ